MAFHPALGCRCQYVGVIGQVLVLNPFQEDAQALAGTIPTLVWNASVISQVLGTNRHGFGQHSHIRPERFRSFRIRIGTAAADDIANGQSRRLLNSFDQFFRPMEGPLQSFAAKPLVDVSL